MHDETLEILNKPIRYSFTRISLVKIQKSLLLGGFIAADGCWKEGNSDILGIALSVKNKNILRLSKET